MKTVIQEMIKKFKESQRQIIDESEYAIGYVGALSDCINIIELLLKKNIKMKRQSIIVFIKADRVETYGNLKKCCEAEGLKYWTLSRLKFPIRINDVVIHKTLFK